MNGILKLFWIPFVVLPVIFYLPGSLLISVVLGVFLLLLEGFIFLKTSVLGTRILLLCVPAVLALELYLMYVFLPQGGLRQSVPCVQVDNMPANDFVEYLREKVPYQLDVVGTNYMYLSEEQIATLPNVSLRSDSKCLENLLNRVRAEIGWSWYAKMNTNPFVVSLSGHRSITGIVLKQSMPDADSD